MLTIKATDGTEFTLGRRMVEVDTPVPYFATRAQIARAFKFKGEKNIAYRVLYGPGSSDSGDITTEVGLTASSIQIGCKKFSEENFISLKRWALRKRSK